MDFDNILNIASQNQGLSNVQKRYSLQTGPPKKDPKSKGVSAAAVQALLKKQHVENKKKELQMKKKKEELLAKRVELKSDRKARAMASRTKDNFKGYNGVPLVEAPKKRGSKQDELDKDDDRFRNNSVDPLDDEDNYEYDQTDSEPEPEPEVLRPGRIPGVGGGSGGKLLPKKPSGPSKPGPSPLNFADLLKLAEKKQFEPVELKAKVVKKEDRLRTADEIRELEMERKAKKLDKNKDSRVEKERDGKSHSSSSSIRKGSLEKEQKQYRPQKNSSERPSLPGGSSKKLQPASTAERGHPSSKPSAGDRERDRQKVAHNDRGKSRMSSSGAINSKVPSKATSSQVSAKQVGPGPSSNHRPSASSDLSSKRDGLSLLQKGSPGVPGSRPSSGAGAGQKPLQGRPQQTRPGQGSSVRPPPAAGGTRPSKGEPLRPGGNSAARPGVNAAMRPSPGGQLKAGSQPQGRPGAAPLSRPGGAPQAKPGGSGPQGHPGRGGARPPGAEQGRAPGGGPLPGRQAGGFGSGPGRPKCTVVSETISSKNFGGPRPGVHLQPGMQQRPGMGPRPGMPPRPAMNRPPGSMLPPITSAYKRKYDDEEEEYDSEMDDFIDDGGEEQDEISRHIKQIFGYDRTKYKDESDYALKFMESSWKDVQKEETRSLRLAVQEDLEEEKREEEELKRKKVKRKRPN
ncbi:protein SPT2 homolog isoform 2-T2 [Menidia menidia]